MNNCCFMGRLAADPVVSKTEPTAKNPAGIEIANFTVCVKRDRASTDFIPCKAWAGTAGIAMKYLRQGQQVIVVGEMLTRKGTGADKHTYFDLNVRQIKLLDNGSKATSGDVAGNPFGETMQEVGDDEFPF